MRNHHSAPHCDNNKVSIIGCGRVGMTIAYTLFTSGTADQIVLVGRDKKTLAGEKLDLEHGMSFVSTTQVTATDDYADIAGSDIVIVSAGSSQKPGDTRLDLTARNTTIIEEIIPAIVQYAPEAVVIIVSNPVDVLTYKAYLMADLPKGKVFGTGTVLDTSRFRFHLSESINVHPNSIHAYILGEHGDSSFAVCSHATIGGQPLTTFPGFTQQKVDEAYQKTRDAAYKIIESKGATYYAIGMAVNKIVQTIFRDARSVLPVSIPLHGQYGLHGVALSVPCTVGRNGVESIIETKPSWKERKALEKCAVTLKTYL